MPSKTNVRWKIWKKKEKIIKMVNGKCKPGFKQRGNDCVEIPKGKSKFSRRGIFFNTIAILSLFLFSVIAIDALTDLNLSAWLFGGALIIAGVGFVFVGQITSINKWLKDGIQKNEINFIITILLGLFSFVMGILILPPVSVVGQATNGIIAVIAMVSIVYIVLLSWVFK